MYMNRIKHDTKTMVSPTFYVSPTHLRKLGVEDKSFIFEQDKWDRIFESMKGTRGYNERYPLTIKINKKGEAQLKDGHHRLDVAIELNITYVPIQFHYYHITIK
tara:strand:+ start:165 stop:476 length:312 start_codon:yes stop_codon:yes gene_type:complete